MRLIDGFKNLPKKVKIASIASTGVVGSTAVVVPVAVTQTQENKKSADGTAIKNDFAWPQEVSKNSSLFVANGKYYSTPEKALDALGFKKVSDGYVYDGKYYKDLTGFLTRKPHITEEQAKIMLQRQTPFSVDGVKYSFYDEINIPLDDSLNTDDNQNFYAINKTGQVKLKQGQSVSLGENSDPLVSPEKYSEWNSDWQRFFGFDQEIVTGLNSASRIMKDGQKILYKSTTGDSTYSYHDQTAMGQNIYTTLSGKMFSSVDMALQDEGYSKVLSQPAKNVVQPEITIDGQNYTYYPKSSIFTVTLPQGALVAKDYVGLDSIDTNKIKFDSDFLWHFSDEDKSMLWTSKEQVLQTVMIQPPLSLLQVKTHPSHDDEYYGYIGDVVRKDDGQKVLDENIKSSNGDKISGYSIFLDNEIKWLSDDPVDPNAKNFSDIIQDGNGFKLTNTALLNSIPGRTSEDNTKKSVWFVKGQGFFSTAEMARAAVAKLVSVQVSDYVNRYAREVNDFKIDKKPFVYKHSGEDIGDFSVPDNDYYKVGFGEKAPMVSWKKGDHYFTTTEEAIKDARITVSDSTVNTVVKGLPIDNPGFFDAAPINGSSNPTVSLGSLSQAYLIDVSKLSSLSDLDERIWASVFGKDSLDEIINKYDYVVWENQDLAFNDLAHATYGSEGFESFKKTFADLKKLDPSKNTSTLKKLENPGFFENIPKKIDDQPTFKVDDENKFTKFIFEKEHEFYTNASALEQAVKKFAVTTGYVDIESFYRNDYSEFIKSEPVPEAREGQNIWFDGMMMYPIKK